MGLSPAALKRFLEEHAEKKLSGTFNKLSGKKYLPVSPCILLDFPVE
ncbi:hypothetical protein OAB91_01080 [Alphaproteobacteria bacterium]|nr:hypothetical protein [Alphaproteobacteria bacterium]